MRVVLEIVNGVVSKEDLLMMEENLRSAGAVKKAGSVLWLHGSNLMLAGGFSKIF